MKIAPGRGFLISRDVYMFTEGCVYSGKDLECYSDSV